MCVGIELVEVFLSVAPAVAAVVLVRKTTTLIKGWFIRLLGTSALAVVSIGMLLTRLTAMCTSEALTCTPPSVETSRIPGIIKACQCCGSASGTRFAAILNQNSVDIQACATALCVAISFATTLRFMIWAGRMLSSKNTSGMS